MSLLGPANVDGWMVMTALRQVAGTVGPVRSLIKDQNREEPSGGSIHDTGEGQSTNILVESPTQSRPCTQCCGNGPTIVLELSLNAGYQFPADGKIRGETMS